ncbi:hypothetical protein TARUN_2702 [Trichoderma arundinaceum]|uniref:Jacalin-type lectin domain-containing protein n=1 Tax=Trichoderma arundinaceum TaxID=490622 RepID=A0A395NU26_TRIAR|nr:hypothetical protein TARUN_2702 [Trichoderma arundinaceum]
MGLLMAPYNNAMRLGQGFNSYTQEICIDDAVIVDPGRPPNPLTNDGTTMLDLRISMKGLSAYKEIGQRYPVDATPISAQIGGDENDEDNAQPKKKSQTTEKEHGKSAEENEGDEEEKDEEEGAESPRKRKLTEVDENDESGQESGDMKSKTPGGSDEEDKDEDNDDEDIESTERSEQKPHTEKSAEVGEDDEDEKGGDEEVDEGEKKRRAGLERLKVEKKKKEDKEAAVRKEDDEKAELKRMAKREEALDQEDERTNKAQKRAREKWASEAASLKPYTLEEQSAWLGNVSKEHKLKSLKELGDTTARKLYRYDPTGARGPSQIVTYSSSDITDDMNISGALSIKYGTIGGSGRGAFINSEKFQESDLNFYISVKVINQTVNMKDALVYQPLRSVNANNFREVYGDSFISGFIEGGEFNAVVSMKVHNKEKITDIRAQAKVALSVGMAEVKAEAAVNIAKKNIENNTETTVQVSWSGGGYIKPVDQPWDINSLTSAAGRFPDLVATTPQRIYAILTKYETLRSFVKLKPSSYSTMQYENAQLHTNMLMDTYMEYKTILKHLGSAIFDVESHLKCIKQRSEHVKDGTSKKVTKYDPKNFQDETPFPSTLGGLDRARRACRFQMVKIVNEIDEITKDPKLATDEDRHEPFQTPRVFKERLPLIEPIVPEPIVPLSNEEIQPRANHQYPPLCTELKELEDSERLALTELVREWPDVSRYFRLTKPLGSFKMGTPFNNIDFLKHSIQLSSVKAATFKGCVVYLGVTYSNGLTVSLGCLRTDYDEFNLELNSDEEEKIIAGVIETGDQTGSAKAEPRITKVVLYTNRGNKLVVQEPETPKIKTSQKRTFTNSETIYHDPVMENSSIKGFWGYSKNGRAGVDDDGIWRLGFIWGNELKPEVPPEPRPTEETTTDTAQDAASKGK